MTFFKLHMKTNQNCTHNNGIITILFIFMLLCNICPELILHFLFNFLLFIILAAIESTNIFFFKTPSCESSRFCQAFVWQWHALSWAFWLERKTEHKSHSNSWLKITLKTKNKQCHLFCIEIEALQFLLICYKVNYAVM